MIETAKIIPWTAARTVNSPNHGPRTGTGAKRIIGVVLHATAGSDEGAESWMASPISQASCHVHLRRDGSTTRMVHDARRAWHAGRSEWRGESDPNGVTLGWEIGNLNNGIERYTDIQYGVLAQMAVHYLMQGLTLDDFVSHAEIARPVGRKNDPLGFDWTRFRRETQARLDGVKPPAPAFPRRVWSDHLREHLIVVRYVSDTEWYFVLESEVQKLPAVRAQTPLSRMPIG